MLPFCYFCVTLMLAALERAGCGTTLQASAAMLQQCYFSFIWLLLCRLAMAELERAGCGHITQAISRHVIMLLLFCHTAVTIQAGNG
jgi:hypothetical protein